MKIIFLDIDGVLQVQHPERDEFGAVYHPKFVENLRTIIEETGAKIVMSASCRSEGLPFLRAMWKHRNYPGEIIGITPHSEERHRGKEIKTWMTFFYVENYVILDDNDDMLPEQMEKLVQTSGNQDHPDCEDIGYGLTKQCAQEAIKILKDGRKN